MKKYVKIILLILITQFFSIISFSEIIILDDFSKQNLKQYDQSHISFCSINCGSYKAFQFLKQDNGNQFIRLTSKVGQLSKFIVQNILKRDRTCIKHNQIPKKLVRYY